jgi:hypothetical protein
MGPPGPVTGLPLPLYSHLLYYTAHIEEEKNNPEIFIVPPGFNLVIGGKNHQSWVIFHSKVMSLFSI